MAGDNFKWDGRELISRVDGLGPKVKKLIVATVELYGSRGEAFMRRTAKWRDRTANARNSLHTITFHTEGQDGIIYAHGMPYGIWLEVRFSGRYSVIMPSVMNQGEALMNTLNKGMARL